MHENVLSQAGSTLVTASAGLGVAVVIASCVIAARHFCRGSTPWLLPVLLTFYALPPTVLVVIGMALDLDALLKFALISVSVSFPITMFVLQAWERASSLTGRFPTGKDWNRVWLVAFPFVLPELLAGLATCIPWLLLSTLLAEVAVSDTTGLGVALVNSKQLPLTVSYPFLLSAIVCSAAPYVFLHVLAWLVRRSLKLPRQKHDVLLAEPIRRLPYYLDLSVLLVLVLVIWTLAHFSAPILVPGPERLTGTFSEHWANTLAALATTLGTTMASIVFGIAFGLGLALLSHNFRWLKWPSTGLLLPLQILPLILFVPLLFRMNLFIETLLFQGEVRAPNPLIGLVPDIVPAIFIATLATAYVAFTIGTTELARLPVTRGGLLESLPRYNWKKVQFVQLPWVARAVSLIADVAMPRALLAVFVVEVLATQSGLGGYLSLARASSRYADAWAGLLLMFLAIAILNAATNFVANTTTGRSFGR